MNSDEIDKDSLNAEDAKKQFESLLNQMDTIMQHDKQLQEPFNISMDENAINDINEDLDNAADMENSGDNKG